VHRAHYLAGVQYRFPHCAVLVDEEARYVETRFEDGTKVGSTPNLDAHTLNTAIQLGYGDDTWAMSRDHELAHTWLALLDDKPWSLTMWRLAHPDGDDLPNDAEVAQEEARVLAFQLGLDKERPRPWDEAEIPAKAPLAW
jgi:hypothetical protein